jgi:hypothetical protein
VTLLRLPPGDNLEGGYMTFLTELKKAIEEPKEFISEAVRFRLMLMEYTKALSAALAKEKANQFLFADADEEGNFKYSHLQENTGC